MNKSKFYQKDHNYWWSAFFTAKNSKMYLLVNLLYGSLATVKNMLH